MQDAVIPVNGDEANVIGVVLNTFREVNPIQPLNAAVPILVTVAGIVRVVNPLQPENAVELIIDKVEGVVIVVNKAHPINALVPIFVLVVGITKSPVLDVGTCSICVLNLLYKTPSTLDKLGWSLFTLISALI